MFNFLKKKQPEHIVSVQFNVNKEQQIELETKWGDTTEDTAAIMGRLLYLIHSGSLVGETVDLIKKNAEESKQYKPFFQAVTAEWATLKQKENLAKDGEDDKPLVPADSFLSTKNDDEE